MAIGTGAAVLGGSVLSGVMGAGAASSAANAQTDAANRQLDLEREIYGDTVERFAPFYDGGLDFQNALRYELLGGPTPTFGGSTPEITTSSIRSGGGAPRRRDGGIVWGDEELHEMRPASAGQNITQYHVGDRTFDSRKKATRYAEKNTTPGFEYQGFEATPGYQFALEQGQNAIDTSAAARGGLFSGATLKAQQEFGTGLANQEYGNYLNRLTGQAAQGQAAAGNIATAGANYTSGAGNALANVGNAQAAGHIGQANAITGGISNAIGAYGYMKPNALTYAPEKSLRPFARPF